MQFCGENLKKEQYFCFQDARFDGKGFGGRGGGRVRVLLIFNKTSGTAKKDQILPDLLNM